MSDQPPPNDPQAPQPEQPPQPAPQAPQPEQPVPPSAQPPQPPYQPAQPYEPTQPYEPAQPYQPTPPYEQPQAPYGQPQQPSFDKSQQTPPPEAPLPPYQQAPQQPYQAAYQQPYQSYQMPPQGPPSRTNGLGIASLVVGGVALIGAVIPFVNYVSWGLGLIGLILGIIGLAMKDKAKGVAIAGTIVSVVAIILSIVLAIVYTAGFVGAVQKAADEVDSSISEEASDAAGQEVSIVYDVTGTATAASIFYTTFNDDLTDTETIEDVALPFSQEITAKTGGDWDFEVYSITATNGADDEGDVSCTITVDGEVVAEETATGAFATVTCIWSGDDD